MTTDSPEFNPQLNQTRWVAYFDLLGVRSLVNSGNLSQVFFAYAAAQKEAQSKKFHQVSTFWFSDSFVFYTGESSASHFWALECVTRWFCYFLVLRQIPVRGAISSGAMYADAAHNLFFGPSLIEAYDYGEAQNWIGFILTPSAVGRLEDLRLPPDERLNYAYWQIPFKALAANERRHPAYERRLPACLFAGATASTSRDFCLAKLASMKANAGERFAAKYDNTMDFLSRNLRCVTEKELTKVKRS
jgi:hypothetical protein